jgi:hypothetical protein
MKRLHERIPPRHHEKMRAGLIIKPSAKTHLKTSRLSLLFNTGMASVSFEVCRLYHVQISINNAYTCWYNLAFLLPDQQAIIQKFRDIERMYSLNSE